ncbi:hypothetical protein BP6252_10261 [Coleophoma cylindrospora]|uniref:Uncharacterized protein n=1 Tax=Coleophoma cylindrospora TaxID=1849047 RepID=A0A3D8QSI9_9HELO|nr:hypothetical protein BP6252_10261 [Coleophoma cylindrospora]
MTPSMSWKNASPGQHIPWIPRPFRADDRFINEDPYAGKAWSLYKGKSFAFERESTVWDDIYPGDFIAIENPGKYGFDGGVDLSAIAANSTEFAAGTQGFGLAFLHQIHCIGVMKHYLLQQRDGNNMTEQQFHHADHCLEMTRQVRLNIIKPF